MKILSNIVGLIVSLIFVQIFLHNLEVEGGTIDDQGKQTWGYVQVRPGAFMFWWLYYSTGTSDYTKMPWIIWLQGGPGASSTGFGNFEEIGPLDTSQNNRTFNWVKHANVLFIDNPVGSGYSYVTDSKLLCTDNILIATDLLTMVTKFLEKVPDFQSIPLYIFSESYGGKMASSFAIKLYKQIAKGKLKCNLKGVNLGDSWISPIDSVLTWAQFLFSTSMVDDSGFTAVNTSAYLVKKAIDKGQFEDATVLWEETESMMNTITNGVNVYNILETNTVSSSPSLEQREVPGNEENTKDFMQNAKDFYDSMIKADISPKEDLIYKKHLKKLSRKHLKPYHSDPLSTLMNGPVKKMLRIIPANVTWGGQSTAVFEALGKDFMKPVVQVVENLLNNTPIAVNVYSGQLDLIVDTMGTLKWVENMHWPGIIGWKKSTRKPIVINNSTEMFVKSFKNFGFYWILKAGHMVPADAPQTALEMLHLITNSKK